jgi:hypothetical protein
MNLAIDICLQFHSYDQMMVPRDLLALLPVLLLSSISVSHSRNTSEFLELQLETKIEETARRLNPPKQVQGRVGFDPIKASPLRLIGECDAVRE